MEKIYFEKDTVFLITGGAGFIGSNLCESILDLGYKVKCLDNLSTGKIENIKPFLDNALFTFIEGDIRDFELCKSSTKDVDYVLHQAAWGSVPRSIAFPREYEDINIKGTLNMLEAARINSVKKFVYASSSSVYGDEPTLPKTEGKEGNLLSPYALTKFTNEKYSNLYTTLYKLDTYGLRYFNVFGKRQDPNGAYAAVIPKFIKHILNNEQPTIYGDGNQSRDFTFIDNVVEANLRACLAPSSCAGQVFNIACGGEETLNDVFFHIKSLLGKEIIPIYGPEREGDIKHSNADISKANRLLNYFPKTNFKQGITKAIEWFVENL
jgi:UDP-N-acetylglucosamine/UDP-N-acetylgalactosamine 4-epimerase